MDLASKIIYQKFKDIDNRIDQQKESVEELRASVDSLANLMQEQFKLIVKLLHKRELAQSSTSNTAEVDLRRKLEESWERRKQQEDSSSQQLAQKTKTAGEKIRKNEEKLKRNLELRKQESSRKEQKAETKPKEAPIKPKDIEETPPKREEPLQKPPVVEQPLQKPPVVEEPLQKPPVIEEHVEIVQTNSVFQDKPITAYEEGMNPAKLEIQREISELTQQFPGAIDEEEDFSLTSSARNAVCLVKNLENYEVTNEKYQWFFKVFFQLQGIQINDLEETNQLLATFFEDHSQAATEILNVFEGLDFSNQNLDLVDMLVQGNEVLLNPEIYGEESGLVALLIFAVKQACIFSGVLKDSKTPPSRRYKRLVYLYHRS